MAAKFGVLLIQSMPYDALLEAVRFTESLGLQNAWIADQLGIPSRPDATFLEAWTTLAGLARDTDRIRIGPLVSNVAMRNPGMLAKHILTVDHMSNGRVDVAIGRRLFPARARLGRGAVSRRPGPFPTTGGGRGDPGSRAPW